MAVVHTPESGYAKETRKWEAHHTVYGPPGRPYVFQSYPTRMYRAIRQKSGDRLLDAETAGNDHEREEKERRGFVVGGQQAALDALEAQEKSYAELAAEINYDARHGMGEKARMEVDAAQEAAGARHLPMIPETPRKPRGRPKKAAPADVQ